MIPALTRRPNQTQYYSHQYLFISILRPLCQMHLVGEKEIQKKEKFRSLGQSLALLIHNKQRSRVRVSLGFRLFLAILTHHTRKHLLY